MEGQERRTIEVRKMREADAGEVASFLAANMHRNLPPQYFRSLFVRPWAKQTDEYGRVLTDGGKIVGCMGAIPSERTIAGRREELLNLTGWCVRPEYRRFSLLLLDELTAAPAQTITNLSPTKEVEKILRAMHYEVLDSVKLFLGPLTHVHTLLSLRRPRVVLDADEIAALLTPHDRKIFDDHAGTGCRHLLLWMPSGYCYVVTKRVSRHWIPFTEILYVSHLAMFVRHLELAKLHILVRDRSPVLAVDERLLGRRLRLAWLYRRTSMFRSRSLKAQDIDNLYSEKAIF